MKSTSNAKANSTKGTTSSKADTAKRKTSKSASAKGTKKTALSEPVSSRAKKGSASKKAAATVNRLRETPPSQSTKPAPPPRKKKGTGPKKLTAFGRMGSIEVSDKPLEMSEIGKQKKKREQDSIKRYTVTAALPYANGHKHIGHLAGAYLPADVYARYLRLKGKDVIFICGSDENGTAIPNQAFLQNVAPRKMIKKYHNAIRKALYGMGISFDVYHRTSTALHRRTSQRFFSKLLKKGALYEKKTEQFYDQYFNVFLADRYIMGICPHCGKDDAYGDQCENCGAPLSAEELYIPRSTLSNVEPLRKPTKHWYLRLEKYNDWVKEWLEERYALYNWKPNVVGQCRSWLRVGLRDRPMTRDLKWGVPVPGHKGPRKKVLYVWFDAPIGYISATKALFAELASKKYEYATPQRNFGNVKRGDWEAYWKKGGAKLVHFVGKDNIVFHCITFPIMLRAMGENYVLPENVPANEFMNLEGEKMSTSRGWSLEMADFLHNMPGRQDALRYAILSQMPETKDSDFTWKVLRTKNNNELLAILGNFVNRTAILTAKHFKGKVPPRGAMTDVDKETLKTLEELPKQVGEAIESYRMKQAAGLMMNVARLGNKYLTLTEPWAVVKKDTGRAGTILNVALQIAGALTAVCQPFLPFTSKRLQKQLRIKNIAWPKKGSAETLAEGHAISAPKEMLYQRITDKDIQEQIKFMDEKIAQKMQELLEQQKRIHKLKRARHDKIKKFLPPPFSNE